jgi:hypothetical protein
MRTIAGLKLGAASLAAVAFLSDSARADAVPFTDVPVMPTAPASPSSSSAPSSIPATEHVDGIFPALPPTAQRAEEERSGYRYINVFASDKLAKTYASDGRINLADSPRACLGTGSTTTQRLSFYVRTKPYPGSTPKESGLTKNDVRLVRLERVNVEGNKASLEVTEAWLDLKTLGTRAASKVTTQLARVATGPNAVAVFAARDDQGRLQFIVRSPELPDGENDAEREALKTSFRGSANRLVAQLSGGSSLSSDCGHIRFPLASKPGFGQMATVVATAFLAPANEPDEAPPSSDDEDMGVSRPVSRTIRTRPLAINVSVSQLASENAPLFSVSLGWAGKDQQARF